MSTSAPRRGCPPSLIPGEAAQALWFLAHRPAVFQEVFFHEEVLEADSWRTASTRPGIDVTDHPSRREAFERELSRFFRAAEGTGRFCRAQHHRLTGPERHVVIAHASDRLRLLDAFSGSGEHRREKLRPASPVVFAYDPGDGSLRLKARCEKPVIDGYDGPVFAIPEILSADGEALTTHPLADLLGGGAVRFDRASGEVRAGDVPLGRVPPHTREFHLLTRLADSPGETVPYADLKRYVCGKTGSRDETDEATFCRKLKSRVKNEHHLRGADGLIGSDLVGALARVADGDETAAGKRISISRTGWPVSRARVRYGRPRRWSSSGRFRSTSTAGPTAGSPGGS